jgi:hypothetical protein
MTVTTLQLTLTLKAPYLTQSSTPTDYGIDIPFAKNHKNQYYIPATLLIGKLREAWQELSTLSAQFPVKIEQWLGQKSDPQKAEAEPESTVEPQRKQFFMEDLVLLEEAPHKPSSAKHYRIRIGPELGSVEKGAYFVTEKPFATGEAIAFQGYARFLTTDEAEQKSLIFCLKKGLQWINQVGANRTIGFGRLLQVEVEPITLESQATLSLSESSRYGLQLRPHAPFCLAERRIAGNLFRSDETISGGAIKGILAMMFSKNLPESFSHIRISHAFPSNNAIRPLQFPLSLVKVGGRYYDVALCETPVLFWEGEKLSAPAFAIDWKDSSAVRKDFGWPQIKRELSVRTAIDSEKRRSENEQLFAYEMVSPLNKQGEPLNWLACIDLLQVPKEQQSQVIDQLQQLTTSSLLGLGKTKTVVDAKIIALDDIPPRHFS